MRRAFNEVFWRRPIFPAGCPASIVGANGFHDRVRDGNGWDTVAMTTRNRKDQGFLPPSKTQDQGICAGSALQDPACAPRSPSYHPDHTGSGIEFRRTLA